MKALLTAALLLSLAAACTPKAADATATTAPAKTATPAPAAKSFADEWDVSIADTPMGNVSAVLAITEADGALGGTIRAQGQTYQLKDVKRTADGMTATFFYPEVGSDVVIELEGEETGDTLSGETMGDFLTTAKRRG